MHRFFLNNVPQSITVRGTPTFKSKVKTYHILQHHTTFSQDSFFGGTLDKRYSGGWETLNVVQLG